MRTKRAVVDIENLETWTKYRKKLCDSCLANCCRMPVEATVEDLIRMGVGVALTGWWGDEAFHRARVAERIRSRPLGADMLFATEATRA